MAENSVITIVDYGTGNLRSIANMLGRLGIPSEISSEPARVLRARKLILPGVGHFDFGMQRLRASGLLGALNEQALERESPILGICLGAQLLTRGSHEGVERGLGWISGETVRFDREQLGESFAVPHMGWTETVPRFSDPMFRGYGEIPRFYYVHSYHLRCDSKEDELCHATYGYRFVAGVRRNNIIGVQFHPEKSHRFGMQLLRNFADL